MGLDISAYRRLKLAPGIAPYTDGYVTPYVNPDFPGRADDLQAVAYSYLESDHFFSRSYGGYNRWREQLAKVAGYEVMPYTDSRAASAWAADSGPFWELINFSDCEGTIGAAVCAKLVRDFETFDKKASEEGEEFYTHYRELCSAFTMGADGGMVEFS